MLRITIDEESQALTLRLEGRLEGPWVAVLAQSFGDALQKRRGRRLRVDLNGVMFVDAKGKAVLAGMFAQGAELLAEDLETKAIVTEIRSRRAGAGDRESRHANGATPPASAGGPHAGRRRLHPGPRNVNGESP